MLHLYWGDGKGKTTPPWGWRCGRWAMAAGWSSCNF